MWAVALKAREGYARGPYLRTDFSRRSSLTTSGSGRPPILSWPPPAALFLPFPWLAEFATDAVPLAMPSPAISRPARLGLDISSLPVLLVLVCLACCYRLGDRRVGRSLDTSSKLRKFPQSQLQLSLHPFPKLHHLWRHSRPSGVSFTTVCQFPDHDINNIITPESGWPRSATGPKKTLAAPQQPEDILMICQKWYEDSYLVSIYVKNFISVVPKTVPLPQVRYHLSQYSI